jgi:hypothetical protein
VDVAHDLDAVALGAGIFLLYDGLRRRPEVIGTRPSTEVSATPQRSMVLGASPLAQGGALTLSGTF